jgi:hypothetical protein
MDNPSIDTGDEVFNRRRSVGGVPEGIEDTEAHVQRRDEAAGRRRGVMMNAPDQVEDTEGHTIRRRASEPVGAEDEEDTEGHTVRTYPAVADDELDCRMPLPGEEDERVRSL